MFVAFPVVADSAPLNRFLGGFQVDSDCAIGSPRRGSPTHLQRIECRACAPARHTRKMLKRFLADIDLPLTIPSLGVAQRAAHKGNCLRFAQRLKLEDARTRE